MEHRNWIIAGLALTVGLYYFNSKKIKKIDKTSKILLIGDSLAQGLNFHLKTNATNNHILYNSVSKIGSTVDFWLKQHIDFSLYSHVLISLGTNDAYTQKQTDILITEVQQLIKTIQLANKNIEIVWILPLKLPEVSNNNRLNFSYIKKLKISVPNPFFSDKFEIPLGPDNLHPTIKGYAVWANLIWNSLL